MRENQHQNIDNQQELRNPGGEKIPWSLLKTLCPEKLDILTSSRLRHRTWESAFRSFIREARIGNKPWEVKLTALQTAMVPETFSKVNALMLQLRPDEREDLDNVMNIAKELIEANRPVWVARHQFNAAVQSTDQTCRQFYSCVAEISEDCDFSENFCVNCKQTATDLLILMKLVFSTRSEDARKEILKKKKLNLAMALEELEADENLKKTQIELEKPKQNVNVIGPRRHQKQSQNRNGERSQRSLSRNQQKKCSYCGFRQIHKPNECPAYGKECHNCKGKNHFTSVCRSKPKETSDRSFRHKKLSRIVCSITKSCAQTVDVYIDNHKLECEIDTGSDWCCAPASRIGELNDDIANLFPPTTEMVNTCNASGSSMEAVGYFDAKIQFGDKQITKPLVFFQDLNSFILSRNALIELGIVVINTIPQYSLKEISVAAKIPTPTNVTSEDIRQEFSDVFSTEGQPLKGGPFHIEMDENAIPAKVHFPRNIPLAYNEKLKAELSQLESDGHIKKVTYPTDWVSPIVIAPKKGTSDIRMCVDFRKLNFYCKREYFQSPGVVDCAQMIEAESAVLFSSFDAKKGYHQIELSEESKDLTTFLTPFGRFRFERAPFGINSIPEHYNRRISEALQGLTGIARLVDDILVYGRNETEHLQNVRNLLHRCRQENIRLNPKKVKWKQHEIEFAGLKISKDGFCIHPKTIEAIDNFPEPDTLKKMRSFHGLANQLAPYDQALTRKLAPLRHLLKKHRSSFKMNEDEQKAFIVVKKHLSSPSTLAFFRPGAPVQIYTDAACITGFGFVLKQKQPDGNWKPIMVGSRSLTDAETRYAPIESEITALAWSLKKAKKFLLGGPRFTVFTDHRPLVSLVNSKRLDEVSNTRILRNLLKCMDYNCVCEYIAGSSNSIADAFSRNPVSKPDQEDFEDSRASSLYVKAIQSASMDQAQYTLDLEQVRAVADNDPEYQMLKDTIQHGFPDSKKQLDESIRDYWNVKDELSISDDNFILYGVRLLIPKRLRQRVLDELHSGHRGIVGVKSRARLVVYWPRIDVQIEQKCRQCSLCETDRPSQTAEPEIHLPIPQRCFQYISADFAEIDNTKFLIITDWKSGWFSVSKMSRTTAQTTIQELRSFFADTTVPEILYTDNGPPFSSAEFGDFCKRWGVRWISSSAHYPQSNSYAENGVKQAKSLLRKCFHHGKIDYEQWTKGLLQIRNTPHTSTGLSSAILVYGHSVRDTVPAHKSSLSKDWHKELSDYDKRVAKERQRMDRLRPGKELPVLKIGDPVVVQNRQSKRWDRYGVVQERNLKVRKYVVRLSSGLITVRNRKDLRQRFPPNSQKGGTSLWSPVAQNSDEDYNKTVQSSSQNNHQNDSDSDSEEEDDYSPIVKERAPEGNGEPEIPIVETSPIPRPILKYPKIGEQTQPVRKSSRAKRMPVRFNDYDLK